MTQQEKNKQVVKEYVAAFNIGDTATLRKLFAPSAVIQGVLGWAEIEKALPIWGELHKAFAVDLTIDAIAAEGDEVAVRYTERGTFQAAFRGTEPTGKSYELVAMEWFIVRDGLIERRWGARDSASQSRQLGIA
jgi:steroid delta-isomerase-like uncharacterized protein